MRSHRLAGEIQSVRTNQTGVVHWVGERPSSRITLLDLKKRIFIVDCWGGIGSAQLAHQENLFNEIISSLS